MTVIWRRRNAYTEYGIVTDHRALYSVSNKDDVMGKWDFAILLCARARLDVTDWPDST